MDWKKERASRYVGLEVIFGVHILTLAVEMPKPRVIDQDDVIVKITGSTICGSDLHLYHGI
jgi:threonine dehydrogenase-like Zn-dependent dehydrogenase